MRMQKRIKHIFWVVISALLALTISQNAYAVAPANATITNTATLTYTGNTVGITASVNVAVTLAPAAPTLASPTGIAPADNTVAENQNSVATYLITANANGPDTYNLTQALTATGVTGNSASATFAQTGAITSVTLGATAASVAAAAGATTITVPADGVADANLNGIANGDEIKIGADSYIVNVTDNAAGSSTITLIAGTLANGTAAPTNLTTAVALGTLIAEQQTFTMNIANVGAINGATPNDAVITTATSATDATKTAADTHVTVVVAIVFEKFVRNVTTANGAAGTLINGQTYFATAGGVTSTSGDTLEYLIRVTADAAAGITGAIITDPLPTFTTYVANSTRLNGITVAADGAASPLAAGLTIDDNNPVRAAGAVASGNVAAAGVVLVTFQVTVD